MVLKEDTYRIMISGGGTGGHVFPAIAIANAWTNRHPDSEILFVGAEGRMEMQKVPEAGYSIVGLKVAGLQRRLTADNLSFPFKLLDSLRVSRKLIKNFRRHAVVGVGGYASGPLLLAAQMKGIPTLIQEQNSYAGLTNKWLAKKAKIICVAYPNMDRFFGEEKIRYTGNPVRKDILSLEGKRDKAITQFGLDPNRPVILVIGGSLGARTINRAILKDMRGFEARGYQLLWQTGSQYFQEMNDAVVEAGLAHVHLLEFIKEMDLAYAVADLVVSRAGALSVSELCLAKKAVIFIPSPNVAEDHQTKNAQALVEQGAAVLLKDDKAIGGLSEQVRRLMDDQEFRNKLETNILKLAKPDAAGEIVLALEELVK